MQSQSRTEKEALDMGKSRNRLPIKQEQERKTPPTNCTFTYLLSLKREKDMSRGEIEATRKKRRQLNLYLH